MIPVNGAADGEREFLREMLHRPEDQLPVIAPLIAEHPQSHNGFEESPDLCQFQAALVAAVHGVIAQEYLHTLVIWFGIINAAQQGTVTLLQFR